VKNNKSARKGQPFNKRQNLGNEDNKREIIRFRNKETVTGWKLCKYIHSGRVRSELSGGTMAIDGKAMKFAKWPN